MDTVGLITEYNPFHNGHLYHLEKSKEISNSSNTVVVMNGNFSQRGKPTIIDKFTRTKIALLNGADIVLELPIYYGVSSAYYFSLGSVLTLHNSNIVDNLCFGSEVGNIDIIRKFALFLNNPPKSFNKKVDFYIREGYSYPKARELAINEHYKDENFPTNILNSPNNILGVEYMKVLEKFKSHITPYTITRINNYHSENIDLNTKISSATSIRLEKDFNLIKEAMPQNAFEIYKNQPFDVDIDNLSSTFQYILASKTKEEILNIMDMNESFYNRLINFSKQYFKISEIEEHMLCKNLTKTRVQRVITNILLNITKEDIQICSMNTPYIRVLGVKAGKQFLISNLIKNSSVPVITNLTNAKNDLSPFAYKLFQKELFASDLYNLCKNKPLNKGHEYSNPLIVVK